MRSACRRGAGPRSLSLVPSRTRLNPTPVPACSCCILLQVVWALGVCPPLEVLTKASKLFERQAKEDGANVLVVLLAAETQVWLDESEEETLRAVAAPFARLIDVYCAAVVRAVGEKAAYPAHDSDDEDEGEVQWTAADASPTPLSHSRPLPSPLPWLAPSLGARGPRPTPPPHPAPPHAACRHVGRCVRPLPHVPASVVLPPLPPLLLNPFACTFFPSFTALPQLALSLPQR